jgi:DNA-binding response OmpR family regulator
MAIAIMKTRPDIFICDSNDETTLPLVNYLENEGFSTRCIVESGEAVHQILNHMPSLVLLDTQLPVSGGFDVCRTIRPYFTGPIIFHSQHDDEAVQLLAFERGADDFIVKPFSLPIMAARINAHLKRMRNPNGIRNELMVKSGELTVDAARREVSLSEDPVDLTSIQFELLWYLANRSGRVVPREELYEALYHKKYNGFDRSVDVYVSRIRQRLNDNTDNPRFVKTIRGVGYLFVMYDPPC